MVRKDSLKENGFKIGRNLRQIGNGSEKKRKKKENKEERKERN